MPDTEIEVESSLPEPTSLAEAMAEYDIQLPAEVVSQVDRYRELLWSWNEKINLTRHTTLRKFVGRDLVDSLQLAELLQRRERVLDIGSGGGVPGVLLAILRPDLTVALCESVGKKANVLEAIVTELQLPVTVYPVRVEQVLETTTFDTLTARAVASLKKMLTWLQPHWEAFDRLLAIKGTSWIEERGEARHFGLLRKLELRCAVQYSSRDFGKSVILSIHAQRDDLTG